MNSWLYFMVHSTLNCIKQAQLLRMSGIMLITVAYWVLATPASAVIIEETFTITRHNVPMSMQLTLRKLECSRLCLEHKTCIGFDIAGGKCAIIDASRGPRATAPVQAYRKNYLSEFICAGAGTSVVGGYAACYEDSSGKEWLVRRLFQV